VQHQNDAALGLTVVVALFSVQETNLIRIMTIPQFRLETSNKKSCILHTK